MIRKLTWVAVAAVIGVLAAGAMLASGMTQAEAGGLSFPLDEVGVELAASGLQGPVDIAFTGLVTDTRMFVVERVGRIKIVEGGIVLATPFLSITDKVLTSYMEEGLLGLAFAPDYGTSGHFFVYYVIEGGPNAGDLQVSRFTVSANPNIANTTETPILTIPHPDCQNHNGGDLNFGPDGYLYVGPGDGGGSNDNCANQPANDNDAQRLNSLRGKILRLNVTGVSTYTVPASNPFTQTVDAYPEIWALGLRNPWRFSFDALTGEMYIADVGQGNYEEVSLQPADSAGGENYGWRCYEGLHPYLSCGSSGPFVDPILEYPHQPGDNKAITGGFVYRGDDYPALDGYYFFADYVSGNFWARGGCSPAVTALGQLLGSANPSTFGQDAAGEIYVAHLGGTVWRLTGPAVPPAPVLQTPVFLPLLMNGTC
jgi:glucose/arabinose dehydrogenase